jgi:hypothetical protein
MDRERRASSFPYGPVAAAVSVAIAAAAALYLWWRSQQPVDAPVSPPVATAPPAAVTPPPAGPASAPAIKHPIEPASPEEASAAANAGDEQVTNALNELVGRARALSFLQLDGFVARVVATVDNLARPHAAVRLWPVLPTPGRFTVEPTNAQEAIGAANAQRYAPLVDFIESVDTQRAVALYRRFYPRFQRAYEELGYPGRYFNDRLVEVIDHLLATPEPEPPLGVVLTEIKGPIQPTRPWVHYEFTDPALASLSSGQKMMLRTGLANERRLKAKLAELRREIARQAR